MSDTKSSHSSRIKFDSVQEAGEYFDQHSLDEFWEQTKPVEVESVEGKLLPSIELSGDLGKLLTERAHRSKTRIRDIVSQCLSKALG